MELDPRNALTEQLWRHPADARRSLLEESRETALRLAWWLEMADPDNDAGEAMAHLLTVVPGFVERFVRQEEIDAAGFRKWSKVVLRHRLLEIKRRRPREISLADASPDALERFAAQAADPMEADSSMPSDAESMLIERDKLVLLLELMFQLKDTQRDLLLARMAGFTRTQLAEVMPFTELSQSVLASRLRERFANRPTSFKQRRERTFEAPELDPPLADRRTPALTLALEALTDSPGTRLLAALVELETVPRSAFLPRLAGFWDCVVAAALLIPITQHRTQLRQAREALEAALGDMHQGLGAPPAPPSSERGASSMAHRTVSGDGASAGNAKAPMARLQDLAEREPEVALGELLADPDVHRALARGRSSRLQRVGQRLVETRATEAARAKLPSAAERLWAKARAGVEDALSWLVVAPQPVGAFRGGAATAREAATRSVVLAFGGESGARAQQHCLVWQIEGERARLVYPRMPGDPTRGAELRNRQLVVRTAGPEDSGRLVLMWVESPALHARLTAAARGADGPEALTLDQVLEGAVEGVTLHAAEV